MSNLNPHTASELYALSQGARCKGPAKCHWCGSPCERVWMHDDLPPLIGLKRREFARVPGEPYVCVGCWLWRRKRISVTGVGGQIRDGQAPAKHSWLVQKDKAEAVLDTDRVELYEHLLNPPLTFSLSLIDNGEDNRLQLQILNDNPEVRADTELKFTFNNIEHSYTPYELKQGLAHGPEGREPGVQTLIRFLGPPRENHEPAPRKRGRPKENAVPDEIRKVIRAGRS